MEVLILLPILAVALSVWLSFIASIALKSDKTLTPLQFYVQLITAWTIPILGSVLVLHFIYEHAPGSIQLRFIPWPFKSMVAGKKVKANANRDENESDYPGSHYVHRSNENGTADGD